MNKNKQYKYDLFFMSNAILAASMSFCKRAKIGAVIVKDGRIISNGWNGTPSGVNNECEEYIDICPSCGSTNLKEFKYNNNKIYECQNCKERFYYPKKILKTKLNVIHAEMNTILFAAKKGMSLNETTLYVLYSPCPDCAKNIIQTGIKRVVYLWEYRKLEGIDILKSVGIQVDKLIPDKKLEKLIELYLK